MLRSLPLLILAFLALPILGDEAALPIVYELSLENAVHHEAEIKIELRGLPPGPIEARMSRTSPGRYALHEFARNVYRVRASDGQGRPLAVRRSSPSQWAVTGHDGTVIIRYTLFGNRADGTYTGIDASHAHLNMPATFMWARGLEERPIRITFRKPQPRWRIATQLAPTDDEETFTARDLQYFMDSPTEISDFTLREWTATSDGRDHRIRLALHHEGTEAEADVYAGLARAVVEEQRAIFGELPDFDHGTYTFIADYLPHVSGDGMEHRNSTILTSTASLEGGMVQLLGTLSHEFFHAWNVERIRPASLEPFDFQEANMSGELWLGEGFTSYYDELVLRRIRVLSLDRYVRSLDGLLAGVLGSPALRIHTPVEMSQLAPFMDGARWADPGNRANTYISYYSIGAALALGLDLTLRSRFPGRSLDDYMKALWQAHGAPEIPYTIADLRKILAEVCGDRAFADEFFRHHVEGNESLEYAELLSHAGLLLRKQHPGRASLGPARFSFRQQRARLDSATLIGSPLYEAGFDRGDVILEIDGHPIGSDDDLEEVLAKLAPGDTISIGFERNGEVSTVELSLTEDAELEIVPVERLGRELTPAMQSFRDAWLAPRQVPGPDLRRYCPECRRALPFEYEHCPFDAAELGLMPPRAEESAKRATF